MKKKTITSILLTLAVSIISCKKFIEVGPPTNQIASATIFQNEETATAAINGLYTTLSNSSLYFAAGGNSVYLGLYSDELYYTGTGTVIEDFANSNLSISNSYVAINFWSQPYQVINQANSCITGLKKSNLSQSFTSQLLGEAYFMRAFSYWNLINLFGDVPLVLTAEDYEGVSKMSRTAFADVRNQILADLKQAKDLLNPAYPTTGRYRVNYYTALAFLSRVHTYLGNWDEVLNSSNEVISQTSTYFLETDLNKTFLIGSTEAIWQTATGNLSTNTSEGFSLIPSTSATIRPAYPIQPGLFNSFSSIDKRKTNWTAQKTVAGSVFQYPVKYKVRTNTVKTEAQMMIRLAEVYLNRAEAKAHLNDPTAIDDLNKTRFRAGIGNLSAISGQPLIDAIMQERKLELFAEWGLRFFDLKRTGRLDPILSSMKADWRTTAALFPIPNAERLAAPNLSQNPGYF